MARLTRPKAIPGSKARIVVAFAAGALAGACLTMLLRDSTAAEARQHGSSAPVQATAEPVADLATVRDLSDRRPARSATEPPANEELRLEVATPFGRDDLLTLLRTFATEEIRRGWGEVREDTVPDGVLAEQLEASIETMLATPAAHGRRAAEAHSELERAATAFRNGNGIELLLNIDGSEPEAAEFVVSEEFAHLFLPRGGASLDGPKYERGTELPAGAVLNYPAGVFQVSDLSRGNEPFPSDVTIRGAGMNATLLYFESQDARSPMQRFAIEDCTIYCDDGITDVRSAPAVLSLRRTRVVGFDCGAGGSYAMSLTKGVALYATDCRFESGYGRNPNGLAKLMRTSGPCLARFERCTFDRVSLDDAARPSVLFQGCTMNDLLDKPPGEPDYVNCRITVCEPAKKRDEAFRSRDLNDLFPQLGGGLRRR